MTQVKTVLITGSSTGIGRAVALYFHQNGWNVAATMRNPSKETQLVNLPNVICPALDVTDANSVCSAIEAVKARFGAIDVVINNAGYGVTGPFEGASEEQIKRLFETNVFGLMRVTKALLPDFRARKSGIIINISSMAGRLVFPFYSVYHGTKWAIEGFTESLRYEVEPFGIRVKLIEPGTIKTDFYGRSNDSTRPNAPKEYAELTKIAFKNLDDVAAKGSTADGVAAVVFKSATDGSKRLRYPVGKNAALLLHLRRFIPARLFTIIIGLAVFRR